MAPLDFEVCRAYYLSVEGSRGRRSPSDLTMVIVNVTDVNDNPPVFEEGGYSVEIMEDLPPGSLVTKVRGASTGEAAADVSQSHLGHHDDVTPPPTHLHLRAGGCLFNHHT